jgi:hypothetical protein
MTPPVVRLCPGDAASSPSRSLAHAADLAGECERALPPVLGDEGAGLRRRSHRSEERETYVITCRRRTAARRGSQRHPTRPAGPRRSSRRARNHCRRRPSPPRPIQEGPMVCVRPITRPQWWSPLRAREVPFPVPRARLLVVPHSVCGPNRYLRLVGGLPDDVEVRGLTLPGRERRRTETPGATLDEVLAALAEIPRPEVPTLILGHSLGATLGLHLAHALGEHCVGLIASGQEPRDGVGRLSENSSDEDVLRLLELGGDMPPVFPRTPRPSARPTPPARPCTSSPAATSPSSIPPTGRGTSRRSNATSPRQPNPRAPPRSRRRRGRTSPPRGDCPRPDAGHEPRGPVPADDCQPGESRHEIGPGAARAEMGAGTLPAPCRETSNPRMSAGINRCATVGGHRDARNWNM